MKTEMCSCGHSDDMHVDGLDQCIDVECGCKEFEVVENG